MPLCQRCKCRLPGLAKFGPWRVDGPYDLRPVVSYGGVRLPIAGQRARLMAVLIRQRGSAAAEYIADIAEAANLVWRTGKVLQDATGGAWRITMLGGEYHLLPCRVA